MRSDKYKNNVKKKKDYSKKVKRKDTMTEDFLAEFRDNNGNYGDKKDDYSDKISKKNLKKEKKHAKKYKKNGKRKKRKWPYIILIILLLIGATIFAAYKFFDSQVGKLGYMEVDNSEFEIDDRVAEELKDYTNIAVLGVDAREGEDASKSRTDAIILVTINKKTGSMSLTSVMRDTYMKMYGVDEEDTFDKATHAHVFGGPVNTCSMLNKNLDLNIDKFVVMDWNSVADVVDMLGGVEVDVQENEINDLNKWGPETAANTGRTWTRITSTGKQTIDGVQAATYCRIRYTSGGDTGRTERMKKVITAIFNKIKKEPEKITKMTDKVFPEITTNMKTDDFLTLVPKALDMAIDNSYGYPFNYWGGKVDGIWLAVATTLEENVAELHEKLFNQKEYVLTDRAQSISEKIIQITGARYGTHTNE